MLHHSFPHITKADVDSVVKQLYSGQIAYGQSVQQFENQIKAFLQVSFFRATVNGTYAIYQALKALQLNSGDEVVLPTYVCHNVYDAIVQAGLRPVLCDVGSSWTMEVAGVEKVVSSKTKCIIIVHPMGITLNTEDFKKFGVAIIEDFCQNFGGIRDTHTTLLKGDFGIYSFHATKCLTTGEGGGIATNKEELTHILNNLYKTKSLKNPLTDLQAALGITQLENYQTVLEKRKQIANYYFSHIRGDLTQKFQQLKEHSIFFRFLLWKENTDFALIRRRFESRGIAIRKGIDTVLHQLYPNQQQPFVNAESCLANTISIPIHPGFTMEDMNKIVDCTNTLL